ncbi:cache domain-containing protein [Undibacterium sp. SXout7W]|uniref:cache domain-containing protein n=1 Tax=Undibacterium sp. SXout7W TaxID=3413049 RepID=UPI003BEFD92E
MKKIIYLMLAILSCAIFSSYVHAAERGNAEEAQAMVKKAVVYIKKYGKDKAYAEFNNPQGLFRDRDLYIVVFDMNGLGLAHINPRLIGKVTGDIKDADGKLIFHAQRKLAMEQGSGWVDYKWPNPVTGRIESKSTYLEKFDDLMIMCGIYK